MDSRSRRRFFSSRFTLRGFLFGLFTLRGPAALLAKILAVSIVPLLSIKPLPAGCAGRRAIANSHVDSPHGMGQMPYGILRTLAECSAYRPRNPMPRQRQRETDCHTQHQLRGAGMPEKRKHGPAPLIRLTYSSRPWGGSSSRSYPRLHCTTLPTRIQEHRTKKGPLSGESSPHEAVARRYFVLIPKTTMLITTPRNTRSGL